MRIAEFEVKALKSEVKGLRVAKLGDNEFAVYNEEKKTLHRVAIEKSDVDGFVVYDITCDCEDYKFRKSKLNAMCKHILTVLKVMSNESGSEV